MGARQPSWQTVARALADRLYWHAQCAAHPEDRPGEDCPHCEDRAAYRMWESKSGLRHRPAEVPGTFIDVRTLLQRDAN